MMYGSPSGEGGGGDVIHIQRQSMQGMFYTTLITRSLSV